MIKKSKQKYCGIEKGVGGGQGTCPPNHRGPEYVWAQGPEYVWAPKICQCLISLNLQEAYEINGYIYCINVSYLYIYKYDAEAYFGYYDVW